MIWQDFIFIFHFAKKNVPIDTVFIGGGTPSLLLAGQMAELLEFLQENFCIAADAEITVECNPASLTYSKLLEYKQAGINRISIGAQSLSDEVLSEIGRCHTLAQLEEAVDLLKSVVRELKALNLGE